MKKIYLLLLLIAIAGGHQFMTQSSDSFLPQSSSISSSANTLLNTRDCSSFRSELEKNLLENEEISKIFWNKTEHSCMYEKRILSKEGAIILLQLVEKNTGKVFLEWSSFDKNSISLSEYQKEVLSFSQK